MHAALDDWTPATNMAFMSKFIGSTDRSFIFQVFTSGTLRLIWTTDGTAGTQVSATSTVAPTIANGDDLWIRVKLDVDNGAGGNDAIFETSTNGVTWTQLGNVVTQAGVTSVFPGEADLEIGSHSGGPQDRHAGKGRSEERRVGKGWVSTCRYRG